MKMASDASVAGAVSACCVQWPEHGLHPGHHSLPCSCGGLAELRTGMLPAASLPLRAKNDGQGFTCSMQCIEGLLKYE